MDRSTVGRSAVAFPSITQQENGNEDQLVPPSAFRLPPFIGLIALCVALFVQPPPVQAGFDAPTAPDADAPYDFSIDLNGDGVPDQLAAALDELNALAAQQADSPVLAAQYTDAMARFASRLPYAPETRARQQALWAVHERLMAAEETDEAVAIMAEMDVLRAEIALDPNFAIADRVLRQRFLDGFAENDVPVDKSEPTEAAVVFQDQNEFVFAPLISNWMAEPVDPTLPCDPYESVPGGANFDVLTRGDLLFMSTRARIPNFAYAIKFSHVGIYHGVDATGVLRVYESNPASEDGTIPEGAQLLEITRWSEGDYCISLMREDDATVSEDDVLDGLEWAQQERYGTGGETVYNYNLLLKAADYCAADMDDCKVYCSQLVWKIFDRFNVDVDSNDVAYRNWLVGQYAAVNPIIVIAFANSAVAPDEVARSTVFVRLSEGRNGPN